MKKFNILKSLAVLALAFSCTPQEFEEITSLDLKRCLEPQNLSMKVNPATGEDVTFSWDVNKDADAYNLVIYTDEAMTATAKDLEVLPAEVPYTIHLTADQEYWFKVRAYRLEEPDAETGIALAKEDTYSNWAVYDGSEKTYAVKDNLFMEVTARTANSVSFAWSKEVTDYKDVTKIVASPVKGGSKVTKDLLAAEINAAAATVDGLAASTEYQFVLYYMSASRGAVDTWTLAEAGSKTVITNEAELKAAVLGGDYYLTYSDAALSMSTAKPTSSLSIVGELGPKGERPVVTGSIDISSILAAGSSLHFENISFTDNGSTSHLVNYSDADNATTLGKIEFVNCEITGYKSGIFYNNKAGGLTIDEVIYDSCDIHDVLGSGGDGFDIRVKTSINTVKFINNTIRDGFRTFVRLDDKDDDIKIGGFVFENNTIKGICVMNDGNNQGFFAPKVPTALTLKGNIFLWEDGGETAADVVDKTQLVRDNSAVEVPTITAENNYSYAHGKDFFLKVSAADAGVKVLNEDPCYNSKGNFFQLANEDLIKAKAGASKWWISYVEKTEDLTQNALAGAHTWNLQDASLFAGEVKNSRVRDELLLVGTEATPLNADGGINFLGASALTRKGVPTEGYIAFKVNTPGSVDLELADGGASSVVVALQDDGVFNVIGGAMATSNAGVQKVVIPAVSGEGIVYLYSTGAISLKKLAWSLDTIAGNKVLSSPKLKVEPVTLFEGDETAVTVTWEAIDNAASYALKFNKKPVELEDGALSYTVPAETIAALEAGLYSFAIKAIPVEGDIYYKESAETSASFAIQPKGVEEPAEEEKTLVWDFTADYTGTAINVSDSKTYLYDAGTATEVSSATDTDVLYLSPNGKAIKHAGKLSTADNVDYKPLTYGGGAAYMFFRTDKAGTLRVTATQGKTAADNSDCKLGIKINGTSMTADDVDLGPYDTAKALLDAQVFEWKIENATGDVQEIQIVKPSGKTSPWIYKVEFVYKVAAVAAPVYKWNFTDDYTGTAINVADSKTYLYDAGTATEVSSATDTEVLYLSPNGKAIKHAGKLSTADNVDYKPLTYGGGAAYMFFRTAKAGTLKVTATQGKTAADNSDCKLGIKINGTAMSADDVDLGPYDTAKALLDAKVFEWKIENATGDVQEIQIVKPSGKTSPWIYEVVFESK